MSEYTQITVDDRDEIRVITLNRPDKLNAWTPTMNAELIDAFQDGNADPAIGAFVVTGAGRGFCAGADVSEVFKAQIEGDDAADDTATGSDSTTDDTPRRRVDWVSLMRSSKPVVAAINGASIGVGLTLVLSMDFLVAHPAAKLSARFVKMGVVPELASSHFLVQRCGWGNASDLALSGRTVLGDEALALGLVDEVADVVVEAAIRRAKSYAENAPASVQFAKQLLTENGTEPDLALVQRRELTALDQAYQTPEHHEAVAAFMERRAPKFR
jgi:2-(1,2-epoxy-1,2-dihydrophenyl)acetyl-CoA isomerase